MIARMTGTLIELDTDANTVLLEVEPLAYEIMVPGYAINDLSQNLNRTITLYCLEYHESAGAAGSNLIPRIIGFPQAGDKAFFQQFIKVKGIGIRKALRALTRPLADVAATIEQGDARKLATLPEIGKRTAELIIAELKGKVSDFALDVNKPTDELPLNAIQREALEILLQLGERRTEAEELLTRATRVFDELDSTDALVQAAYRLKAGSI